MEILPLAADSMGLRSMATLVDTGSARVLIDPGVTLAPERSGLPPTAEERQSYEEAVERIVGALCQVDAVVVTRYDDEHMNLLPYVLSTTATYLKTPASLQEQRIARELFPRLQRTGRAFELVEGSTIAWREMKLTFSPPLPPGKEGWEGNRVMAAAIRSDGRCFVHGSDIQGPVSPVAVAWFLQQEPDLLYLSGLAASRVWCRGNARQNSIGLEDVRAAHTNLLTLLKYTRAQIILDHHLFQEAGPRRWFPDLFATGRVQSAADYLGQPERLLEARRRAQARRKPGASAGLWDAPAAGDTQVNNAPALVAG